MHAENNLVQLIDYSIFKGELMDYSFTDKTLINTINQYSYCIGQTDSEFKKALQGSDILLPDGMAIVAAIQVLSKKKIKKIAGSDVHQFLLNNLNERGGSCFYLGSSETTLLKIKERIALDFPNIKVNTFSPPYKSEFSAKENQEMINAVNNLKPDILFIGMTAPKQEKWAFQNKEQLDAKIICCIGAVFDFYAGTVMRPNPFWIKIHLEWLIRLLKEPKRLWKRYLYYGPVFIISILRKKFQLKKILI